MSYKIYKKSPMRIIFSLFLSFLFYLPKKLYIFLLCIIYNLFYNHLFYNSNIIDGIVVSVPVSGTRYCYISFRSRKRILSNKDKLKYN